MDDNDVDGYVLNCGFLTFGLRHHCFVNFIVFLLSLFLFIKCTFEWLVFYFFYLLQIQFHVAIFAINILPVGFS